METNTIYDAPKANLVDFNPQQTEGLENVLHVAKQQKALIYTFLVYFVAAVLVQAAPPEIRQVASLIVIPIWIAIIILNARLCWKVYGKFFAVVMIILGIVPIINFLVVVAASSRANRLIKKAGFKVGFMGANTTQIKQAIQQTQHAAL
ncbi:hypothetical protein [Cellvibrio sp. KY-YJ-3]|uniref:hypothetical protein n=1 Tax=Cellvibrio sp. KY-YJ-3 TaxID=454662 RepID=UPI0012469675|nr:hypothetical protein [Cellvibrio sp. KY-YJ-3]QEY13363.1 hypothetical protein D0B88_14570 [Cellvibrio sp. KY-YJ-3]